MGEFEDLQGMVATIGGAVGNIRQDIADIKANLPATGGLTAEQVTSLKASLQGVVDSITELDLENPAPPTA